MASLSFGRHGGIKSLPWLQMDTMLAVAPDLRGFSDSESPPSFTSYTSLHVVGDLIALIDYLGADKVFLVGHDWGAQIGWYMCLFRPDRVKAYVSLTVPFRPRNPNIRPIEGMRAFFGDDYYMCRFQVFFFFNLFPPFW